MGEKRKNKPGLLGKALGAVGIYAKGSGSTHEEKVAAGRKADAYNKTRGDKPVKTANDFLKTKSKRTAAEGKTVKTGVAAGGRNTGPMQTPRTKGASQAAKPSTTPKKKTPMAAKPKPKAARKPPGTAGKSGLKALAAKERAGIAKQRAAKKSTEPKKAPKSTKKKGSSHKKAFGSFYSGN